MTTIPEAAKKKHLAILGINGAGKSSADKGAIIEPALKAGERVCIIDPKGEAWGLRLGANGSENGGLPIYIVGGERQDFPLNGRDGALWAEIVATSSDSFAFDLSTMTVGARSRWFTEFAETLLRKNKGPLNLTIDEVHLFAPQAGARAGGKAPAMLHATNNLLALGRSKGLRVRMISQRPAKVHKDALTQAHTLVAMMMVAPHDRKAVADWIADQADEQKGREIIASLPSLKPGEAWVWAPAERYLERVRFPMPKTYDSSKAPDEIEGEAVKLRPIDPKAVSEKLKTVAAEAKANDPAALKAEVARLTKALATAGPAFPMTPAALEEAHLEGYAAGAAAMHGKLGEAISRAVTAAGDAFVASQAAIGTLEREFEAARTALPWAGGARKPVQARSAPAARVAPPKAATPAPAARTRPAVAGNGSGEGISAPLKRIIDAIAWWGDLGAEAPSPPQVAFVAGYSHKSGTWRTYISQLRTAGLIEGRGDLKLTDAGLDFADFREVTPTGDVLREIVLAKIDAPLARILTPVLAAYPNAVAAAEVAEVAGYSHTSGTWRTYLSKMRGLDLIERRGDLKAQGWLFP